MTLEKEVTEMTEEEFKSLNYTPLVASLILSISERMLIKIVGERGRVSYEKMIELGHKRKMLPDQVREKIKKVCNYVIVPEDAVKERQKISAQTRSMLDELYKKIDNKYQHK